LRLGIKLQKHYIKLAGISTQVIEIIGNHNCHQGKVELNSGQQGHQDNRNSKDN